MIASDCVHKNDALEPSAVKAANTENKKVVLDGSEMSEDEPTNHQTTTAKTASTVMPDGIGEISDAAASILVGKYKAATYCNHTHKNNPFFPLCFRGIKFSIGSGTFG